MATAKTGADPSRERWNKRWAGERAQASTEPSAFLVAEVAALRPGRALDVACGAGRNAVWLARRGWRVTAFDFSEVALRAARELAVASGVSVEWLEEDAVAWTPPARACMYANVLLGHRARFSNVSRIGNKFAAACRMCRHSASPAT